MIKKVYGQVDGKDVIFEQNEEGLWQCEVPFFVGKKYYVVELYAIDEADNESYYATALFLIDSSSLTFKVEFVEYGAETESKYKISEHINYEFTERVTKW